MFYLVDSANPVSIAELIDRYPLVGVTTNPTLIAREEAPFASLIAEIRRIIGAERMLHIQTSCDTPERIVEEAVALQQLAGDPFYAKVPVTPAGIHAMLLLKPRGIGITATAIFTPQQAMIAARAGADFVAPYVNRLDNIGSNGADVVADIVQVFTMHSLPTRVLAASFKNVEQVHQVCMAGAYCATISPELYTQLLYHPLTDMSVAEFKHDGPACPRWFLEMEQA